MSSHESLDVLGGSLTLGTVFSFNLVLCYGRSQGQPWSPALPWGHRSVPLAFPAA